MRSAVLLLAIFGLVAAYQECVSTVRFANLNLDYTLFYAEENGGWMNATDENGNTWFFSSCPIDITEFSPSQDTTVAVWMKTADGELYNRGDIAMTTYNLSPFGENQGLEAVTGTVLNETAYKTVIEYVCDNGMTDNVTSVEIKSDTYTVITVVDPKFCPISDAEWDDDDDYENNNGGHYYHRRRHGFFSVTFIAVFIVSFFTTCVCCCCIRRRKCRQQARAAQMKQFSNVAFQPIPAHNPVEIPLTQPTPAFNPYLQNQQFMYYYPAQPQTAPQGKSDEQIARELQAQFDREQV